MTVGSQTASKPIVVGVNYILLGDAGTPYTINSLGIVCVVSGGASLTYSVQVTADPPSAIVNWINHNTIVSQTGSTYGSVIYPITALRLNVSAYSSGTVSMGVVQWP